MQEYRGRAGDRWFGLSPNPSPTQLQRAARFRPLAVASPLWQERPAGSPEGGVMRVPAEWRWIVGRRRSAVRVANRRGYGEAWNGTNSGAGVGEAPSVIL